MVKHVTKNDFDTEIKDGVVVVDFAATWCGPCKMLGPILEDLSGEYEGKIKFLKVDVDDDADLAMQYKISSVPALIAFKNGEVIDKQIGLKQKDDFMDIFDEYL